MNTVEMSFLRRPCSVSLSERFHKEENREMGSLNESVIARKEKNMLT